MILDILLRWKSAVVEPARILLGGWIGLFQRYTYATLGFKKKLGFKVCQRSLQIKLSFVALKSVAMQTPFRLDIPL